MLLIISGKSDGTIDALVDFLDFPFFRLNLDDFRKYKLDFANEYWEITNPAGLKISSETATNCFWWKAFMYQVDPDKYIQDEIKLIAETIYSWFVDRKRIKGNPPYFRDCMGKISTGAYRRKVFEDSLAENWLGSRLLE